jgi:hypothetical protein
VTYPIGGIKGWSEGVSVGSGLIGEKIDGVLSNSSAMASTTYESVGSVTVTAGCWMIYGSLCLSWGTAPTVTSFRAGPSTTAATIDLPYSTLVNLGTLTDTVQIPIPPYYLETTATEEIFLVGRTIHTGTNPFLSAGGSTLFAVRKA